MARYRVRASRGKRVTESEPTTKDAAYRLARYYAQQRKQFSVVIVTEDQEGADHPANAGQFFLHRIFR